MTCWILNAKLTIGRKERRNFTRVYEIFIGKFVVPNTSLGEALNRQYGTPGFESCLSGSGMRSHLTSRPQGVELEKILEDWLSMHRAAVC